MSSDVQSVGRSAVLAGMLWAMSVAAETVFTPQRPDGSVDDPLVFGLLVAASALGSVLLVHAFSGLRVLLRGSAAASRPVRIGAWCCVAGAVLLLVFSLVVLLTGLFSGAVWEPAFLAFALGLLLLLVGQATLGLGLRRTRRGAGGVWTLLVLAAAWIVLGIVVPFDPWHDIGMFGLFATWVAIGNRIRTTPAPHLDDEQAPKGVPARRSSVAR